jgi:lipopolysaccharide transport system ATP-binding protein
MKPAIRVDGLSKRYRIGARQQPYHTLRETLSEACLAPWRRLRQVAGRLGRRALSPEGFPNGSGRAPSARREGEAFWALKDVSFEVQPGEVVGIIGRNGAGKSTLLKILSRVTEPTAGRVELRGRVGSLLEVGTGFHPELTGRENIYMNGSLLGMSRREIQRKFDEIVEFSGVEEFLDTPVKRYSSGMYVRLAFAVAAHLEPEILIVDEVLAVGDAAFQQKCLQKMEQLSHDRARTVLFVSHNLHAVARICQRALVLSHGEIVCSAPAEQAVLSYLRSHQANALLFRCPLDLRDAPRWGGSGQARLTMVEMIDPECPQQAMTGFRGSQVTFRLWIQGNLHPVKAAAVQISDLSDRKLVDANSIELGRLFDLSQGTEAQIDITIRDLRLRPGSYKLGFGLGDEYERAIDVITEACVLEVLPPEGFARDPRHAGVFYCPFEAHAHVGAEIARPT